MIKSTIQSDQRGFTIVELMIATTVLSVILLITTVSMISIGNLYFKGYNQSRIQNDVRTITDSVTQNLKFDGVDPITDPAPHAAVQAYCIGSTRYTYVIGARIGYQVSGPGPASGPTYQHVLWQDTTTPGSCIPVNLTLATPSAGGSELVAPNSRLLAFSIGPAGTLTSPYSLNVSVAYGEDDLIDWTVNPRQCKTVIGDQFCAIATLNTIVARRQWE